MDRHAGDDCAGCEWERQPQAFRWFPELGAPFAAHDAVRPMALTRPVDDGDGGDDRAVHWARRSA